MIIRKITGLLVITLITHILFCVSLIFLSSVADPEITLHLKQSYNCIKHTLIMYYNKFI